MVLADLVANFISPLAAILPILLPVLDAFGPIARDLAAPIRAVLGATGAVVTTPGGTRVRASRSVAYPSALGPTVL
jgi:hypothetical protein